MELPPSPEQGYNNYVNAADELYDAALPGDPLESRPCHSLPVR